MLLQVYFKMRLYLQSRVLFSKRSFLDHLNGSSASKRVIIRKVRKLFLSKGLEVWCHSEIGHEYDVLGNIVRGIQYTVQGSEL